MKSTVETAASMLGLRTSAFIRSSVLEKAQEVIKTHESITLSQKEWASFVEILDKPYPRTPAAKRAIEALKNSNS
ncbi:MAG: DUF1778 domain-containing protein [Magnetococcales bacterium]|nr:DUF1778 domain-containing protein [Magnetococcales bacterium]